jgi:hypothetical protein
MKNGGEDRTKKSGETFELSDFYRGAIFYSGASMSSSSSSSSRREWCSSKSSVLRPSLGTVLLFTTDFLKRIG